MRELRHNGNVQPNKGAVNQQSAYLSCLFQQMERDPDLEGTGSHTTAGGRLRTMRRKRVKVKTCQITVGEYHAYALCGRPARFKTPGDLLHKDGLYVCGIHARALAKRKRDPLYCKPMEEFYDPEQCPFEIKGFFEEFLDPVTGKMIGIRSVQKPTRKLGSDGMIHIELTEEMWLKKGKNMVIVKASKERPIKAIAMIQILCGRLRYNIEAEKAGTFYPQNPDKVIAPKRKKS